MVIQWEEVKEAVWENLTSIQDQLPQMSLKSIFSYLEEKLSADYQDMEIKQFKQQIKQMSLEVIQQTQQKEENVGNKRKKGDEKQSSGKKPSKKQKIMKWAQIENNIQEQLEQAVSSIRDMNIGEVLSLLEDKLTLQAGELKQFQNQIQQKVDSLKEGRIENGNEEEQVEKYEEEENVKEKEKINKKKQKKEKKAERQNTSTKKKQISEDDSIKISKPVADKDVVHMRALCRKATIGIAPSVYKKTMEDQREYLMELLKKHNMGPNSTLDDAKRAQKRIEMEKDMMDINESNIVESGRRSRRAAATVAATKIKQDEEKEQKLLKEEQESEEEVEDEEEEEEESEGYRESSGGEEEEEEVDNQQNGQGNDAVQSIDDKNSPRQDQDDLVDSD
eukprot:TRINITY_DN24512_c0_g1_i18.p1 TRINITY_DN24512_c0_g1~~TRINITY_DN24512_c0_g1_i18.p1  ORF type:complete len:391 (-),score=107.47 TRINITY_DN24512_c0_g1_i18:76-1248(-)